VSRPPEQIGPSGSGRTATAFPLKTGLLKQWPAQGPPLAWKIKGIGAGYSGFPVSNGRIYTMGDLGRQQLYHRAQRSGRKQIWAAKVAGPAVAEGYPGPRCTPAFDGDLVFALASLAISFVSKPHGRDSLAEAPRQRFRRQDDVRLGYSESPLVDGDRLIWHAGGPRGTVVALDKKTGAELWRTKDLKESASYSSIVRWRWAGSGNMSN